MNVDVLICKYIYAICFLIVTACVLLLIVKPKGIMQKFERYHRQVILAALIAALVTRYAAVWISIGVPKKIHDFNTFLVWSETLLDQGFSGFMSDYTAGFSYILAGLRALQRLIGVKSYVFSSLLFKSPAIISEVLLGMLAYKWSKMRTGSAEAVLIGCLILFNPAQLLNSSVWGQVEGLLTLPIALSLYYLDCHKNLPAALCYTAACLIKPQAIFFAPVVGMFFILPLLKKNNNQKVFRDYILPAGGSGRSFYPADVPVQKTGTSAMASGVCRRDLIQVSVQYVRSA